MRVVWPTGVALVGACALLMGAVGCSGAPGDSGGSGVSQAAGWGTGDAGGWGSVQGPGGGGTSKDAGVSQHDAGGAHDGGGSTHDASSPPSDGFDQFQHHNLDDLNNYRSGGGIPPLVLDQTLCTFALAGSQELSQDHSPHAHFINAANNGTSPAAAENQGDPNGWPVASSDPVMNEMTQIDQILATMYAEGPSPDGQWDEAHGHYMNMMNGQFTRVGVGLLEVGGHLYLTNDFY